MVLFGLAGCLGWLWSVSFPGEGLASLHGVLGSNLSRVRLVLCVAGLAP